MKSLMILVAIVTSLSSFASDQTRVSAAIDALNSTLDQLVASDLSCGKASDCEAVAVGDRACGGPSRFVVVSQKNLNYDIVKLLASKLEERESSFNSTFNIFSICSIEAVPALACVKKRCAAKQQN